MKATRRSAAALLVAVWLLGECASASAGSLPGKTSANPELESDTLRRILSTDLAADKACEPRQVVDREVISVTPDKAIEHWTVDRCGTLVQYTVTYLPDPQGGTLIGLEEPVIVRKGPDQPALSFPKEFAKAWFRSGDRRFSLKAYSASGKLIVHEERISFGEHDDAFDISFAEVNSVSMGQMPGDTANDWVIVRYGSPEKAAGFKDGSQLGWGKETPSIYSAVTTAFASWSAKNRQ